MSSERRHRIEEVFDEALEVQPEDRAALLDERCGDDAELRAAVEALLASDDTSSRFLEPPVPGAALSLAAEYSHGVMVGETVGRFRLESLIASGGMGTVYKAVRDQSESSGLVAVKLIKRGMDTDAILRRFELERAALGRLAHPNIAMLLDGGATDAGAPYLVMEYVDGLPIDRYCDDLRLSVSDRLSLLRVVCAAVQHAHRNLIIHRDLKPSNILVTRDGVPKLVDFGIAKLLEPDAEEGHATRTETQRRLVTPLYASPEVLRGEPATTATDVYSLGVVAYELLAGYRPYDSRNLAPHEITRQICEIDPPAPSVMLERPPEVLSPRDSGPRLTPDVVGERRSTTPADLRRRLSGDLDTVVLKAMHKDPDRRYESVEALSQDIRRHLTGFPVVAQGDSVTYRVRKFVRRHRAAAAAAVLVTISLVAGVAGVTYGLMTARSEAALARAEAAKARQINRVLQDMLGAADPETGDPHLTVRAVLDRAGNEIDRELVDQPDVLAAVHLTIGEAYLNLGLHESAAEQFRNAKVIYEQRDGSLAASTLDSVIQLSRALTVGGDYEEADALLATALADARRIHGSESALVARALIAHAKVFRERTDLASAESLLREAVTLCRKLYGDTHRDTAQAIVELGLVRSSQGKYDEAIALCREALAINRRLFGDLHPRVSYALRGLGVALHQGRQFAEAESVYKEALTIDRKLLGNEHPNIARLLNNLGAVMRMLNRIEEAEAFLREALAIRRKVFGNEHTAVANTLTNLATVLDKEKADPLLRESIAINEAIFGPDHLQVADAAQNLAVSLRDRGRDDEAELLFRRALMIYRKHLGDEHLRVSYPLLGLGDVLTHREDAVSAEPLLRECMAIRRTALSDTHPLTSAAKASLGTCLLAQKKYEEAEPLLLDGYTGYQGALGVADVRTQSILRKLVDCYTAWGKADEAKTYSAQLVDENGG